MRAEAEPATHQNPSFLRPLPSPDTGTEPQKPWTRDGRSTGSHSCAELTARGQAPSQDTSAPGHGEVCRHLRLREGVSTAGVREDPALWLIITEHARPGGEPENFVNDRRAITPPW